MAAIRMMRKAEVYEEGVPECFCTRVNVSALKREQLSVGVV